MEWVAAEWVAGVLGIGMIVALSIYLWRRRAAFWIGVALLAAALWTLFVFLDSWHFGPY